MKNRYSFKQESFLKPLHSNLMRIGFAKYLLSESFKHLKFELDLDHDWQECQKVSEGEGEQRASVTFFLFINILFDEKLTDELDEILSRLILDFVNWNSQTVELKQVLKSLKDLNIDEDVVKRIKSKAKKSQIIVTGSAVVQNKRNPLKVFIIHGHDEVSRLKLEKLLKEFRLYPVVLMDMPGESLGTIITKFEKEASECDIAMALFTPDDEMRGGSARPRQNVILELGYFMGRDQLNNRKIIVLKKTGVEGPSDIAGVETINFDKSIDEIAMKLQRQLQHWKVIN